MLNIVRYFTTSNQTKAQLYVIFSLLCAIQGQPRITGERKPDFWSGISLSSTDGFRFYLLRTFGSHKASSAHLESTPKICRSISHLSNYFLWGCWHCLIIGPSTRGCSSYIKLKVRQNYHTNTWTGNRKMCLNLNCIKFKTSWSENFLSSWKKKKNYSWKGAFCSCRVKNTAIVSESWITFLEIDPSQ